MKKVFFVVAPSRFEEKAKSLHSIGATVPYGILSIITYLKRYANEEIEYKVFDFNLYLNDIAHAKNAMKEIVLEFQPDIIGIAANFNECRFYIEDIVQIVKKIKAEAITLVGGAVGTNLYSWLFANVNGLDGIVFSEGEEPLRALIDSEDMKKTLSSYPAFLTADDYNNGKVPQQMYVDDLDILPYIDFSIVDYKKYGGRGKIIDGKTTYLPIHTSRGCPFNCVFCAAGSLHGKKLRKMTGQRVLDEIMHMKVEYGLDVLQIDDDQFLLDKNRAKFILKGLANMNIRIAIDSGVSVRYIDEEIAKLLKEAQINDVFLAIESGSDRVLKEVIDKPATRAEAMEAIRILKRENLTVKGFFVIGFPGETKEERNVTLDFVLESELDWANFYAASPFEGTRLFDICLKKGYLTKSMGGFFDSRIDTGEFSSDDILEEAYSFNLRANFISNYNLRVHQWEKAINIFEDKVKKYPEHAFAWYSLAKAYEGKREMQQAYKCKEKYLLIVQENSFWKKWHEHFSGEILL